MQEQTDDLEWRRYHLSMPDGGPIYNETRPGQFIVEPWNAFSSLLFLIPALYWAYIIRKKIRNFKFLGFCIPLLVLGGVGSTLFHAFRVSRFFLLMDVLPIAILTIMVSIYFWLQLFKKWWYIFIVIVPSLVLRFAVWGRFPAHTAINISYFINGATLFLPLIILLFKMNFQKYKTILLSLVLFLMALVFREIDARDLNLLPMGTHFLWHVCSAVGAWYLAEYLYFLQERRLTERSKAEDPVI